MKTKSIIKIGMTMMFILLFSVPTFSQVKFGVRADVGINNPNFNTLNETFSVQNKTTYSVGPSIEVMFLPLGVANFGIDAALLYNDNRMSISGDKIIADQEVSNRYLNLPINAKLKFGLGMIPLRIFTTAGPWAGYLISSDELKFSEITDDIMAKEFQAGANLGFGVEVFNMLQLGLNYSIKLTDNYSINKPDWKDPLNGKNESWTITGTIYF